MISFLFLLGNRTVLDYDFIIECPTNSPAENS